MNQRIVFLRVLEATKGKGIGKDGFDFPFLGLVGSDVEVARRVRSLVVDGGRNDVVLHCANTGNHFDGARAPESVTVHGLG